MTMPLWFYDLAVYCLHLTALISIGGLTAAATRLRRPQVRLVYLQILLALGLLLPAAEPRRHVPQEAQSMAQASEHIFQAGKVGIETAVTRSPRATPALSIYDLVAVALVAGFLFRLFWLAMGFIRLRRCWHDARPLGHHAALAELKARLGISPAVLVSDQVPSPAAFGWRTPRVLLPTRFMEMRAGRQRVILYHEFLHVRRRDWRWQFAEEIVRALFWFDPAVLWLIAQIRLTREQVVDSEVVALTGGRSDYLDALFEIAASAPRCIPASLFLSEHHLKRRVALILKEAAMSRKKMIFAFSTSFGAPLLAGVLAAALLPLRTSAAEAAPSVKPPLAGLARSFYSVSIKPGNSNSQKWSYNGGQDGKLDATNVTVEMLIVAGYEDAHDMIPMEMPLPLEGLPAWAKTRRYTVRALGPPDMAQLPPRQVALVYNQMFRSLLAERFKLRVHHATRQMPVYELVVAKGGLKLKPARKNPISLGTEGGGMHCCYMVLFGAPASLAPSLSRILGRTVVDRTGLTGDYDIELNWKQSAGEAGRMLGISPSTSSSIIGAVQQQLGLDLTPATDPVDVLVVDHLEPPTPN
jgi:bla regulator protein blaR1